MSELELGAVTESVTVAGEVPLLQTESATTKSTFENKLIEDVPSGGRNIFALMYNQPGVVKTSTYWGSMELYASGNVNGVSIGGGVRGENETVVDGVANTRNDRGISFVPSINGTQEFTVQSNTYDAQFGRTGGGVTMITLKSGTNQLHGQLFEYLKNEKLRTNDWVANKEGETEPVPFKNNTFGFEVDGPIFLPKIYDGRNKAFFMLSLESLQERALGGERRTLPSAEQIKGDFSQLRNAANQLVTIYDPLTTRLGADGKTYERSAFPGNVIPASRINPIAAQVASFYPAPNLPGDGPQHINNYAKRLPARNNYNQWLGSSTTPSAIAAECRDATARLRGRTMQSSCGATIRPSRAANIRRCASSVTGAPTGRIPSARRSCSIFAAAWRDMRDCRVIASAPVTIRLS